MSKNRLETPPPMDAETWNKAVADYYKNLENDPRCREFVEYLENSSSKEN